MIQTFLLNDVLFCLSQIYIQILGIAVTTAWSAVASLMILVLVDKTLGLRVPVVHEEIGLDISQLHETIIDIPTKKLKLSISKAVTASQSTNDELDGGDGDDLDNMNHGDGDGNDDDVEDNGATNTGTAVDSFNAPPTYTQKSIISGLSSP